MKITKKLFFTLLGVTSCIVIANLALARWSFQQGFLDFVHGMERQRLTRVGNDLLAEYESAGESWAGVESWELQGLKRKPRGESGRSHRPHPPPGGHGPRPQRSRGGPPRGPEMALAGGNGPPTGLFDVDGSFINGVIPSQEAHVIRHPLLLNGKEVGELRSWPSPHAPSAEASEFARQQWVTSLVIAALCLVLAGIISWWVAKRLLRPVKSVLKGVSQLTDGQFQVHFTQQSRDELGQLMIDIETLSQTLEKNRTAKNRWFADISHELRTPLTVLSGEIEVLKAGIRPLDINQLNSLEQEIGRLKRLVDDLYHLSLSDLGGLRYHFEPLDLSNAVAMALQHVQLQADKKGLVVEANLKPSLWIKGDNQRIEQLLMNLLTNSVHYTDAPGKLICSLDEVGHHLVLTIEDTPPGVEPQRCEQLFDPLYREDSSRSRRTSGAGLGLTICRNIVEAHGGKILASPCQLGGLKVEVEFTHFVEKRF